ncbi:MAG TPA: AAA family ATPase, partial [Acidimicrobiales bacterium]|nr:AAA family ATPase [Acidimicrobiales bacterium]
MIRAEHYLRRVVDGEIDALVSGGASAIAIEGAKAVGKSATAAERAHEVFPLEESITRQILEADPTRMLTGATVLIDEWQRLPSTWDAVRRAVDAGARPGQFFLTGSASATVPGTHSGAGRILKLHMRPMTLSERGIGDPTVSFAQILSGSRPPIEGTTAVDLPRYVAEIVNSGFPGIRPLDDRVRRAQLRGYIDRVIDRDIRDATGRAVRNAPALRRWLAAYAAATATTSS